MKNVKQGILETAFSLSNPVQLTVDRYGNNSVQFRVVALICIGAGSLPALIHSIARKQCVKAPDCEVFV